MNVPKLRFKGFSDNWTQKSLGEVSQNVMYGMNAAAMAFDGQNKYIRITDIDDESRTYLPSPLTSPSGNIESKFKLQTGDIVFARTGASVGKAYLYNLKDGDVFFAGFLVKFSVTEGNPYFVFSQTLTGSYDGWVKVMSMRSGQPGINAEEYKEFKFLAPQFEEQTKIANFLTAIDEKIIQLTQKYDLLKQYKKGVMQQIFSQKLRFKDDDGREFPEWEEKKLGDISRNIMYGMNASAIPFNGNNKYIRITDIDDESRSFKPSPLSSPSGNIETKFKMQNGDIVFARTGASVGKSYLYDSKDGDLFFAGFLIKFSISEGNPYFIFLQTLTEFYRAWVKFMSMRSGQPGINAEEYKDFEIIFPCLEEQTKIANFLTAIDDKITQTQTQLNAVKQYKKGLLQQLFV